MDDDRLDRIGSPASTVTPSPAIKPQRLPQSPDLTLTPLPPSSPSTPLLPSDPESQPLSPSPTPRKDKLYILLALLLFLAIFFVSPALAIDGVDPLNFGKLASYCAFPSLCISALCIPLNERLLKRRDAFLAASPYPRALPPFVFFLIAVIYWGIWLMFFGIAWLWAVVRAPGSGVSVLKMMGVWREVQGVMGGEGGLERLASCLSGVVKEGGKATLGEWEGCLRGLGVGD